MCRATERGEITYVPSGNTETDSFQNTRAIFSATKGIIIIIIIIQFFIYVRAELNSQWPITESARIQTAIRQHRTKLQQRGQQNKHKK
jgi:hypothetical protein